MRWSRLLLLSVLMGVSARAQYCEGREVSGPYGIQFSGDTAISKKRAPVAGMGRIVFAGDRTVNGYSTVEFDGLLLGNPVTGTYSLAHDCTLSLDLQDDSGAFQHFRGRVTDGGRLADLRHIDPGTGEQALLVRSAATCDARDLRAAYTLAVAGAHTPVDMPNAVTSVSAKGTFRRDYRGVLSVAWNPGTPQSRVVPAAANVQSDCVVEFEFDSPAGNHWKLRGILVNHGAEILSLVTNPGEAITVRFTAR